MRRMLLVVAMSASAMFAQTAVSIKAPIALDKLPSGDLYALSQYGVSRFQEQGNTLVKVGSISLPVGASPSDIVSAVVNKQPALFVAYLSLSRGYVSQIGLDGRVISTWTARHLPSGLDYDPNTSTLYVAAYDSAEIYSTSIWNSSRSLQYFGSIRGARRLGPVVVDSTRQQLIVADVQNGDLYSVSLRSKESHLITTGLSSPQALLLGSDHQSLYIADAGRAKVYRLNLANPNSSPTVFASSAAFKEPLGLALLSAGKIAVADDLANALFLVSPSGNVAPK